VIDESPLEESSPVAVKDLRITPGRVDGRVAGRRERHEVAIHVAPLESGAWEGVVSALAADPALVAAILDGELPAALVAAAEPCTLDPSPGELRWACGCRRSPERCAHVRAVWREAGEALRKQPALVLALRGRDAASLAADASRLAVLSILDQDPGVDAAAAYGRTAVGLAPLPEIHAPAAASRPGSWLEPDVLPRQQLLDQAVDAASRALDILRGTGDGCLELDRRADVARIGASFASPWDVSNLAWRAGMSPVELRRLIRAWEAHGTGDLTAVAGMHMPRIIIAATSEAGPVFEQLSLLDARSEE